MKAPWVLGLGATLASLLCLAPLVIADPPYTPPPGLVAWWSFEEVTEATAQDNLDTHPGTYDNEPLSEQGKVFKCKLFNGTDQSVRVPDSDEFTFGSADFTILLWARFKSVGTSTVGLPDSIFVGHDQGGGIQNKWFFAFGGERLYFHVNGPGIGAQFFPQVEFTPEIDRWYHLGVRRTGNVFTIFVDGEPLGSASNGVVIPNTAASLTMAQAEGIGRHHGNLDEVMIFSRALEDNEIQAIQKTTAINTSALLSMY